MDDYLIRGISAYTPTPILSEGKSQVLPSGSPNNQDFQQVLTAMLLASTMSNSAGSSNPLGGDLFSPVLFSLIERLLTQQQGEETGTLGDTSTPHGLPVTGRLTQEYHPGHNGLDFGVPVGTPIRAAMDGKVIYAGWNDQGYGNLVIVENGPFRTYYAHLSSIPVVEGQVVQANSVVGMSGNTGNSTGPHLHYEVRQNGQPIDPSPFTLE